MPNYTGGASVCPFYQRETPSSIICEGVGPCQHTSMKFCGERDKLRWQREYWLQFYEQEDLPSQGLASLLPQ